VHATHQHPVRQRGESQVQRPATSHNGKGRSADCQPHSHNHSSFSQCSSLGSKSRSDCWIFLFETYRNKAEYFVISTFCFQPLEANWPPIPKSPKMVRKKFFAFIIISSVQSDVSMKARNAKCVDESKKCPERFKKVRGFIFVPLIASTVGQLHPDFLRFLWHYSRVPSDHPLLYELYTTGEVRFGYSQGDDLLRTIQKALFFRLEA